MTMRFRRTPPAPAAAQAAGERAALRADALAVAAGWAVAQVLFAGYEAHVPLPKRLIKGIGVLGLLLAIRQRWGRRPFQGALLAMTAAIGVLHGYWFHIRHGIHWRTAEPREAYLALIGQQRPGR